MAIYYSYNILIFLIRYVWPDCFRVVQAMLIFTQFMQAMLIFTHLLTPLLLLVAIIYEHRVKISPRWVTAAICFFFLEGLYGDIAHTKSRVNFVPCKWPTQTRSQDLEKGEAFLKGWETCKQPWPEFSLFLNQNHTVCRKIETEFLGKLGNSNVFSAQKQVVSKKQKTKKRSSPKSRLIFRPKSEI